jgi:hypothetical protein
MIYILQLIYIKEGQEEVFHQFEDVAIPIISKYNGRLLLRVRPDENSFIEHSIEKLMNCTLLSLIVKRISKISSWMKNVKNFCI